MNQEKIGNLIKKIRKNNNLTQKQLADKYGVTYQAVSKWENGKNIPDISLIKQMSKDFNIDIEDILEGKVKQKKNKKIYLFSIFLILIVFIVILIITRHDNFNFSTLSSQCANYNITGSIAYNNTKSSIYISDIKYCGNEEKTKYKKIECILYEKNKDKEIIISKNIYDKEPIELSEYLKKIDFKIDDYKRTCKKYNKNSFFIKIKTTEVSGKIKTQMIKLSLDDKC